MCTERGPDQVVVCDVAGASVRAAFRTALDAAIRPHGGALPA